MTAPLISPATRGDLIKRESDPDYTRETVTLKAGATYPLGAVLGRITATGVYAFSPAASTTGIEGAEIANAVLIHPVAASDTDTHAVVLARGQVIVSDRALVFDTSVADATAQSLKHQQLAAHGIVVRAAA